jgi:hypothetical protein
VKRTALAFALFGSSILAAQSLVVYSEFRRVGPDGEIVASDREGKPREVLSPAVARNAFTSFRLVITAPPGKPFSLHIGENPESIVQVTLYREIPVKTGAKWIPDKLDRVALPATGYVPLPNSGAPETSVLTYWMDLWVPAHAPVRRIRVEAQLNVGSDWIIYPLEVRIMSALVPPPSAGTGTLPPLLATSAEAAFGVLQGYLCGKNDKLVQEASTVRELIRRNAGQDVALARRLEPALGKEAVETSLAPLLGAPDAKTWCTARASAPATTDKYDPETYLKIRDYLIRTSVK